jgi:hypothetical protein
MREELRLMAARLAARDQAVTQHIQVGGPGRRRRLLAGLSGGRGTQETTVPQGSFPPLQIVNNLPQSLEASQLETQRAALDAARAQSAALHAAYGRLRDSFLSVHTALSPHNLGVAIGAARAPEAGACSRLGLGDGEYEALTSRLIEAREVSAPDADLVVARVREVLAQASVPLQPRAAGRRGAPQETAAARSVVVA